ncbi:MAG: peptidoglycan DD-metalloendopeptidase family protein [Eubacteriales bacterium]|nr:peptidoglycan DD-metalloendopeptidase family protein [Eubacteriales bacterium]
MTGRIWRRRMAGASLLFIIGMFLCLRLPVQADEVTSESIKQKEASIESAKQEREQIQSNLSNLKQIKEELQASKDDLTSYITELDASLTQMQGKIDTLKTQIADKETQIEQTELELEEAQARQQEQYEAMKRRIRFMYERGSVAYLEVLLEAGSFGEMLNKATYVELVARYDREMLDEYAEQAELVALTKEALEEEKETLDAARASVEQEEANMESLISEKQVQVASVEGDIENQNATIAEYEAQMAQQNAEIQALEAAVAAEKEQLAAANQQHYNGGVFAWPAPSYTYISSEYGYRIHPIYGDSRFHNGLDMAAPGGSPILAAYDGTVVAASYSSSMGNYIMIDHGDGLYTIYMHASALYVSKGASVTKGQQIAAVGSTGNSTGNHLHFSVRLNGSYVSPWDYLG